MSEVGSVELGFKLQEQALLQQVDRVRKIVESIPDLKISGDAAGDKALKQQQQEAIKLASLLTDIQAQALGAKAALSGDKGEQANLARNAQLLQESLRYKKQLAEIDDAGFKPEDVQLAQEYANTLNRLNVKRIEQEFQATQKAIADSDRAAGGFFGKLNGLAEATQQASQFALGMQVVSKQLLAAGQSINQVTNKALEAAAAFDSARAKVATLTGESQKIADQSRSLASELGFQKNSIEILNAQYEILSSGFGDAASAAQVLKASVLGSQGGFSDLNDQVDATTTLLNAYGLSADNAAILNDKLIQTQNVGKLTLGELAPIIGRVATQASAAGVSVDEMFSVIATATAKGVSAESSVAGLRQAIAAILKPSQDATEIAKSLGVEFNAQALKTKGLAGVLQDLSDKGGANVKTLTALFGSVEAVSAILPSTGQGAGTFANNLNQISSAAGSAQKAADAVANSFEGQLSKASAQATDALISLGQGVAVAVTPLLQSLNFLLENFNQLPGPIKEGIGVIVALTGGLVTLGGVAAAGAASIAVLQAGLAFLVGSGTAAGAATGPVVAFGTALKLAVPILGLLVAGLAAVRIAKFGRDLKEGNEALDEFGKQALEEGDRAFKLADRIKAANDRTNASRKEGTALSQAEIAANKRLVAQGKNEVQALQEKIAAIREIKPASKEQENTQAALIKQYELAIAPIQKQTTALQSNGVQAKTTATVTRELITEQGELAAKYTNTTKELENAAASAKAATAQQLADGQLRSTEAAAANLATEKKLIQDKIALNQKAQAELEGLRAEEQGKGKEADPSKIIALDKQIRDLSGQTSQFQANLAQNQVQTQENALAQTTQSYQRSASQQKAIESGKVNDIKKLQLSRAVTEQEANKLIADAKVKSVGSELAIEEGRAKQIKSLRDQGKITEEQAQKELLAINERTSGLKVQQIEAELGAQRAAQEAALSKLDESYQRSATRQKTIETNKVADIRKLQLSRAASEEQASKLIADGKIRAIGKEISLEENRAAQIRALRASGVISEREAQKQLLALADRTSGLKLQKIEAELAARRAANEILVRDAEQTNAREVAAIANSQQQKIRAIRAAQMEGVIGEKDAQIQIAKVGADTAETNVRQKEQELARIRALRQKGAIEPRQFAQQEIQLQKDIESARTAALEAGLQTRLQAQARALEIESAQQKAASQAIVRELEAQNAGVGFQIKQQERLKQATESRVAVNRELAQLGIAQSQAQLDQVAKAQEAAKRLAEGKANPQMQAVLQFQVQDAGLQVGQSELDILKKRQELEDRVANRKLQALAQEQAITRSLEESEAKRQKLAALQALNQEKIAASKAQQAVSEAELALRSAKTRGNEEEILLAQEALNNAKQSEGLAQQNVRFAQEGVGFADQIANDRLSTLALRQQNESSQAMLSERDRRIQQAASLAEGGGSLGDVQARLQQAQQIPNAMQQAKIPLPQVAAIAQQTALQSQPLAQQMSGLQQPGAIVDVLKGGNGAIVAELKTQNQLLQKALGQPSQLVINGSQNPIADATKFYADVSHQKSTMSGI